MRTWTPRSKAVVGTVLVAVAALAGSSRDAGFSLSTYVVHLAWMLLIVGVAVGMTLLVRGRRDR